MLSSRASSRVDFQLSYLLSSVLRRELSSTSSTIFSNEITLSATTELCLVISTLVYPVVCAYYIFICKSLRLKCYLNYYTGVLCRLYLQESSQLQSSARLLARLQRHNASNLWARGLAVVRLALYQCCFVGQLCSSEVISSFLVISSTILTLRNLQCRLQLVYLLIYIYKRYPEYHLK
jgi:hypothetical protein